MTNEEIEKKAAFLADNLNLKQEHDRDYLRRMVLTLVSLAYEEAARADCVYCGAGRPVYYEPTLKAYIHGTPGAGYIGSDDYCEAPGTRALKDSLQPDSVPA